MRLFRMFGRNYGKTLAMERLRKLSEEQPGDDEKWREELAMMTNPADWPLGHYLPLKRNAPDLEPFHGVLVEGQGPTIYTWDLTQSRDYESFEAIVSDGWVVD